MTVTYEFVDGVAVVSLASPATRNALDATLVTALSDALDRAVGDRAAGVVLRGEGRAFCGGVSSDVLQSLVDGDPAELVAPFLDAQAELLRRLEALPLPTVAAVTGAAVGPGLALVLGCDLRVAGESAKLIPGFFQFGGSPDGGLSWAFVKAFGSARAVSLSVRNTTIGAADLLAAGLVEDVVPDERAVEFAIELIGEVAGKAPAAWPRLRSVMAAAVNNGLEQQLEIERLAVEALWTSDDFRESLSAWSEGRDPVFRGV